MNTSEMQAPDAAINETDVETSGADLSFEDVAANLESGEPRENHGEGAVTPLEAVTDWKELEERLRDAESADSGEPEEAGAVPPPAEAREEGEARALPKNFRLHTEDPQRAKFFQLLRQHPEANPVDLARMAGFAGDENAEPTSEAGAREPRGEDPVQALRDEIADLVQRKRAHREAYEFDKADELGDRLLEVRLELESKTREVAESRVTQAKFDAAYQDARSEAARLHPAALQPGSRQHRLVRLLVAAKELEGPEFFEDPAYPLRLLGELERDFPESFPRRVASGSHAGDAKGGRSRLVGQTVAGNVGGSHKASRVELERSIEGLGAEELLALANAVGTQPGEL